MSHDISIIIVNYNQQELTLACLDSLLKIECMGSDVHIIVVDNGSPEVLHLSKKYLDKGIILLRSDANLGFTGGNNMGIHAALERFNSDFVWLLNNDTVVDTQALGELLAFTEKYPQYGIVSNMIYFFPGEEFFKKDYAKSRRGHIIWYAGGSIDWRNLDNFHRGVDERDVGQLTSQLESDFATGCSLFIRRETLEKIGLLRKMYFLYYEDADWSVRATRAGYGIGFCASAKIWHHNAGSTGGAGSQMHTYYQTRNRLIFFWTFGSWRTRLTVISLSLRNLVKGSKMEQKATWHALIKRIGKQPIT